MRALTHKAESQYDESETSLAGYNGGERQAHGASVVSVVTCRLLRTALRRTRDHATYY